MGVPSSFTRVSAGAALDTVPAEPVLAADLKAWLRVTSSAEDALLGQLCVRARLMAERLTGRTIKKTRLVASWDQVPGTTRRWWDGVRDGHLGMDQVSALELPLPPLVDVEEVRSYNDDDTSQVMDASNYRVDASDPDVFGRLCLKLGVTWPVFTRTSNGLKVTFVAGYEAVPEDVKHAILLMAAWLYTNRGDCSDETCSGSCGAMGVLARYKVLRTS